MSPPTIPGLETFTNGRGKGITHPVVERLEEVGTLWYGGRESGMERTGVPTETDHTVCVGPGDFRLSV